MNQKNDIILVASPFLDCSIPSIQLATLEASLQREGLSVHCEYLYVKFAKSLTLKSWNLIKDLESPELLYRKQLFPDWHQTAIDLHRIYFESVGISESELNAIEMQIDNFVDDTLQNRIWSTSNTFAFSISYYQLAPSLYLAKRLKQKYPKSTIIFGGAGVSGLLGRGVLLNYDWVDYIVDGHCHSNLNAIVKRLKAGLKPTAVINGLFLRSSKGVTRTAAPKAIELNALAEPNYSGYFTALEGIEESKLRFARPNIELYLENARGCYWRKCTFCSSLTEPSAYREQEPERLLEDMVALSNRHSVSRFRLSGETYSKKRLLKLARLLKASGNAHLDIMLYIRAGLSREEYRLLSSAGVKRLMIGIEQFSASLLEKMKKGVHGINNIHSLIVCSEENISVTYNLFVNYPTFSEQDYTETVNALSAVRHLQPPYAAQHFQLQLDSPVIDNPEIWGITEVEAPVEFQLLYPQSDREKSLLPFSYDYSSSTDDRFTDELTRLINDWYRSYEDRACDLHFTDNGIETTICKKTGKTEQKNKLEGFERQVFLACREVISRQRVLASLHVNDADTSRFDQFIDWCVSEKIMYREGEKLLSLPIDAARRQKTLTKNSDSIREEPVFM